MFTEIAAQSYSVPAFLCSVVLVFWGFVSYYVLKRKYLSNCLPGVKLRSFDVWGDLKNLQRNGTSESIYSYNISLLQLISSYTKLFRHKKLFCLWISYSPFLLFVQAQAVEELISGTRMMEKSWSYKWLHPWLGTGLLTSHGPKWKSRRKLLTPSFHFDILKDFLPIFNEQAMYLADSLRAETQKAWTDIIMPITLCTLDIICETTLGVTVNAQKNSESEYVTAVLRASGAIMERLVYPPYLVDFIFNSSKVGQQFKKDVNLLHGFTKSVIREKKQKLLCGDTETISRKRKALMDLLLEQHIQNQNLSEEDIREEVDTFAFEGHDTTSMGINWTLYLIGLYKDAQSKIHEELDQIFGRDTERFITTDDLNDMKYLERVVKESQRLYPSVPLIARQATEDTMICGYKIPKGASCVVVTYELHRDPAVFPEPERFDPDRFLPENSIGRHPFAYIPFSAGPRNCIGQRFAMMEEKVVIANILRRYTLESLQPRDQIAPATEIILRASGPIKIKIRPRKIL